MITCDQTRKERSPLCMANLGFLNFQAYLQACFCTIVRAPCFCIVAPLV